MSWFTLYHVNKKTHVKLYLHCTVYQLTGIGALNYGAPFGKKVIAFLKMKLFFVQQRPGFFFTWNFFCAAETCFLTWNFFCAAETCLFWHETFFVQQKPFFLTWNFFCAAETCFFYIIFFLCSINIFSSKWSTFSCIINYFLSSQSNFLCNLSLFF